MAIYINNKDISSLHIGDENILEVYVGTNLVWPLNLISCFSNGYWINTYPYINSYPYEKS